MGTWLNADGLYVKFGQDEAISQTPGGAIGGVSTEQSVEWTLELIDLTETETIQNDVVVIPDNAQITKIEVMTLVAATLGTAIDVGLCHISRNVSDAEFTADPDGLLAAYVTATMNTVGENYLAYSVSGSSIPAGVTTRGALIGAITTAPCLLTASRTDSTAFGAGKIRIKLFFIPAAATY